MENHFVPYLKLEGQIINGIRFNFPTDKRHFNQAVIWNVNNMSDLKRLQSILVKLQVAGKTNA